VRAVVGGQLPLEHVVDLEDGMVAGRRPNRAANQVSRSLRCRDAAAAGRTVVSAHDPGHDLRRGAIADQQEPGHDFYNGLLREAARRSPHILDTGILEEQHWLDAAHPNGMGFWMIGKMTGERRD
jgi:hypothetical protein